MKQARRRQEAYREGISTVVSRAVGISAQGVDRSVPGKTNTSEMFASECPLCGSGTAILVKEMKVEPLIDHWYRQFGVDVRDQFCGLSAFELCVCECCSLPYFCPTVLAGSPWLYSRLSKLEWYYQPWKWEYNVALKDLQGCRKILEIGCGSGEFIARAWQKERLTIEGLESNADAVAEAQRRGLPVTLGNIHEVAERCPGQYDAVCGFQVLEHVPCPLDFLQSCLALLAPRGRFLLGLPNADSFLKYQFNLFDLPPHHVTRWSAQVLNYLPRLLPIRLQAIRFEPLASYHVKAFLDAHFSRLEYRGLTRYLRHPLLEGCLAKALALSQARRLFRGQTLYASFARVQGTP